MDGNFELERKGDSKNLVVSYIGYMTEVTPVDEKDDAMQIFLKGEIALDEVVVSERKMGTIASRTSVLQTQKITYDEICRAACCNLAESFETNPSVDVSYSDAATGARQIKLLGLAGTYVQMLTENYPNFRGAASLVMSSAVRSTYCSPAERSFSLACTAISRRRLSSMPTSRRCIGSPIDSKKR